MERMGNSITFVATSCGRHDLLRRTLHSFLEFADIVPCRMIVCEDGQMTDSLLKLARDMPNIEFIVTGQRVGQLAAIDFAYCRINTPLVFHCEDDWEFYRTGFMAESLEALAANPKAVTLWLRDANDTNGHPYTHQANGWRRMIHGYNGLWHGFTWNPGLRRKADIPSGGYGSIAKWDRKQPWNAEAQVGAFYKQHGCYALLAKQGYVRHIGEGRHVR